MPFAPIAQFQSALRNLTENTLGRLRSMEKHQKFHTHSRWKTYFEFKNIGNKHHLGNQYLKLLLRCFSVSEEYLSSCHNRWCVLCYCSILQLLQSCDVSQHVRMLKQTCDSDHRLNCLCTVNHFCCYGGKNYSALQMKSYKETWRAIVGWQEFFTRSNLLAREGVLPNQVSILKLVIPKDVRTHSSIRGYQRI